MAKQVVNIGTFENDNKGDKLRDAFDKINDNFDEVYGAGGFIAVDTTAKIDAFTAAVNSFYIVNNNGGDITATIPSGSVGDVIKILAYRDSGNGETTLTSTEKINGSTSDYDMNGISSSYVGFQYIELFYTGSTNGWVELIRSNKTK